MTEYKKPVPSQSPSEAQQSQIDRKFGMFIHFGINTFINEQWSDGLASPKKYAPTEIDADGWVKTAHDAGMNYVVLITKHHDGFCMWNTALTDYCVNNSGNTTDVVAEVSRACKKYGLKLGLYYSLWDRHEKSYTEDFNGKYIPYMKAQLTELLDGRYGDICELWFDGAWDKKCDMWHLDEIYDLVKRLQPNCVVGVNHTIGDDDGGFPDERFKPENYKEGDPIRLFPSDFRLWDPYMTADNDPKLYTYNNEQYYLPFEMTICLRSGFSWFWTQQYDMEALCSISKTAENCRKLFEQDNCAVINLPPKKDGKLDPRDVEHILKIADVLKIRRN